MADVTLSANIRNNLLALQNTSALMKQTQNRLATGLKVASAVDDPVAYFQGKALSDRSADFGVKKAYIDQGVSTLNAATNGIQAIESVVKQMQGLVLAAKSATTSGEIANTISQFNELRTQINSLTKDASYQGLNLINGTGQTLEVSFSNVSSSYLNVKSQDATSRGLGINRLQTVADGNVTQGTPGILESGRNLAINYQGSAVDTTIKVGDSITISASVDSVNGRPQGLKLEASGTLSFDYGGKTATVFVTDTSAAKGAISGTTTGAGISTAGNLSNTATTLSATMGTMVTDPQLETAIKTVINKVVDNSGLTGSVGALPANAADSAAYKAYYAVGGQGYQDLVSGLVENGLSSTQATNIANAAAGRAAALADYETGAGAADGNITVTNANASMKTFLYGGATITGGTATTGPAATGTADTSVSAAAQVTVVQSGGFTAAQAGEITTATTDAMNAKALALQKVIDDVVNAAATAVPGNIGGAAASGSNTAYKEYYKVGGNAYNSMISGLEKEGLSKADATKIADAATAQATALADYAGGNISAANAATSMKTALYGGTAITAGANTGPAVSGIPPAESQSLIAAVKKAGTDAMQAKAVELSSGFTVGNMLTGNEVMTMEVVSSTNAAGDNVSLKAGQMTLSGIDYNNQSLNMSAFDGVTSIEVGSQSSINALSKQLEAALTSVRSTASTLGSNVALLSTRLEFTTNYMNTLTSGAGKLTLADLNEESANMLALQTRQQLGIQSLSMANQAEQGVLGLFR